jgi:NAD(P)-dependent dehydrogenase (short-subunit alcohol dehydrogenase family)
MNHYPSLADRVILITGAAHGLGAALATSFAEQGSRLALVDVDAEALTDLHGQLGLADDRVTTEVADLADTEACEPLVARVAARMAGLDVLVNNAAVLKRAAFEDVTVADFELTLRVNLLAPWFLSRAAIAVMRRQGRGGRIVNVASMAGRTGGVASVHTYAASKGALLTATRSLARAVAAEGILVNAVLPSNIESPMLRDVFPPEAIARTLSEVPLGRTAEPREVAELVLWLASDASSYVTGVAWDINGGWFMS